MKQITSAMIPRRLASVSQRSLATCFIDATARLARVAPGASSRGASGTRISTSEQHPSALASNTNAAVIE
jgi:hypothetical protein